MQKRYMTQERKRQATVLLKEGKTDAEIAKRMNFPIDAITEWRKSTGIPEANKGPAKEIGNPSGPVITYTDPARIEAKPEPVKAPKPTTLKEVKVEPLLIEEAARLIRAHTPSELQLLYGYLKVYLELELKAKER